MKIKHRPITRLAAGLLGMAVITACSLGMEDRMAHAEMVPDYPTLTVPIEVVHGRADRTVGLKYHAERLEAEVDSVNLTRVKGMGHMPHHADPQLVAETIRRTAERAGVQQ